MRRKNLSVIILLVLLTITIRFSQTVIQVYATKIDMAVTSVSTNATSTSVVRGKNVEITVDVKNNNATGTITWYVVQTLFDSQLAAPAQNETTPLGPGDTKSLTFIWDTDNPEFGALSGNYTIKARITRLNATDPISGNNELSDGWVAITVHDVAVVDVRASPTGVSAGQTVQINATVENKGDYDETFDVTAYWNKTNDIDTETVTALENGTSTLLTFTWSTTGLANGHYTIGANASAVTDECQFDIERNNHLFDGIVRIPPAHDVAVTSVSVSPKIFSPGTAVQVSVVVQNEGDCDETFDVTVYYDNTAAAPPETVSLAKRKSTAEPFKTKSLTFDWDTTRVLNGSYAIKAVASVVSGETDTADNTKIDGTVYIPNIYVGPSLLVDLGLTPGSKFNMTIGVADIVNLFSFEFYLRWYGPILNVTEVYEGPFLAQGIATEDGDTFFTSKTYNAPNPLGESDYTYVTNTLTGSPYLDVFPVSGSGILAWVEFLVEDTGRSGLHLYDTQLLDTESALIPHTVGHGSFDNEGWAARGYPGDVDGDHDVDIVDLGIIARAMGTDPTWPHGTDWGEWNPYADLNSDEKVDIFDLFIVAINYGQPY